MVFQTGNIRSEILKKPGQISGNGEHGQKKANFKDELMSQESGLTKGYSAVEALLNSRPTSCPVLVKHFNVISINIMATIYIAIGL